VSATNPNTQQAQPQVSRVRERPPFSRWPIGTRDGSSGIPGGAKHGARPPVRMLRPFRADGRGYDPPPGLRPGLESRAPSGRYRHGTCRASTCRPLWCGCWAERNEPQRFSCPLDPAPHHGTSAGAHDASGSSGMSRRSFSPIARSSLSGREARSSFSASVSFLKGGRRFFFRTFLGTSFCSFR